MRAFRPGRFLFLATAVGMALSCAGCPELNRQPDRSVGPLFSVDDPAGRESTTTSARDGGPVVGLPQFVISQEGGLPDQSRRAH